MPRTPTTEPAASNVGSARGDAAHVTIGPDDAVVDLRRAPRLGHAGERLAHALAVALVDRGEMCGEGAVEVERVDTVDPVELGAPLHLARAHVPEPAADVRERLAFVQARLGFGEHRLGEVLLGDVVCDGHHSDHRSGFVDHGPERERHRHVRAVVARDLRFVPVDATTGADAVECDSQRVVLILREQRRPLPSREFGGVATEETRRGDVAQRDRTRRVEREHRVVRRVDQRFERGNPLGVLRRGEAGFGDCTHQASRDRAHTVAPFGCSRRGGTVRAWT